MVIRKYKFMMGKTNPRAHRAIILWQTICTPHLNGTVAYNSVQQYDCTERITNHSLWYTSLKSVTNHANCIYSNRLKWSPMPLPSLVNVPFTFFVHSACREIVNSKENRLLWNSPTSMPPILITSDDLSQSMLLQNFCSCQGTTHLESVLLHF